MMGLLPNLIRRLRSFDIERLREGPKCCYHWAGGGRQGGQRWDALLQRAKDRGGGAGEERDVGWLLWLRMGSGLWLVGSEFVGHSVLKAHRGALTWGSLPSQVGVE